MDHTRRGPALHSVRVLAPLLDSVAEQYGVLGFRVGSRARSQRTGVSSRRIALGGASVELVSATPGLAAAPPGVASLVLASPGGLPAGDVIDLGPAGREVSAAGPGVAVVFVDGPGADSPSVAVAHPNTAADLAFVALAVDTFGRLGSLRTLGRWSRTVPVPERAAARRRLRLGAVIVEVLVPTGPGPVADLLGRAVARIAAVGVTVPEIRPLKGQLGARGIRTLGPERRREGLFLRIRPPQAGDVPLVFVEPGRHAGPDAFG